MSDSSDSSDSEYEIALEEERKSRDDGRPQYPKIFISHTLRTLLNSEKFSDVIFHVGQEEEEIYAHRLILASRSPVFKSMFYTEFEESRQRIVVVRDMRPVIFLDMLQAIYTDRCKVRARTVVELLFAAKKYQIASLIKKCVKYLKNRCGVKSACSLLNAMPQLMAEEQVVINFIEDHAEECLKTKAWSQLSQSNMVKIYKSDQLAAKESSLFTAMLTWAKARCTRKALDNNPINIKKMCEEVIPHVRFPIMTSGEFSSIVVPTKILPNQQVMEIYKYMANLKVKFKPPQKVDYNCTVCTFFNTADKDRCEICQTPAPPPTSSKIKLVAWPCPICTFVNKASRTNCELCTSPRPPPPRVEEKKVDYDFPFLAIRRRPRKVDVSKLRFLLVAGDSRQNMQDVQTKIREAYQGRSGYNDSRSDFKCDLVPVTAATITLEQLEQYDAVLTWTGTHRYPDKFGDLLADYTDKGGGVVVAAMALNRDAYGLSGRFDTEGYNPFKRGLPFRTEGGATLTIGKGHPARRHPIMRRCKLFEGGLNSSRNLLVLNGQDAKLIGNWDDNLPFAAEKKAPLNGKEKSSTVVTLNFYPVSSTINERNWDRRTDGGLILLNSLIYAASKAFINTGN